MPARSKKKSARRAAPKQVQAARKKSTGRKARAGSRRAPRRVFSFEMGRADGDRSQRNLLGGKGANLAEMCKLGLPVPPGFTISTEVCKQFEERRGEFPAGLEDDVAAALRRVERALGKRFGDTENPLLLSVRSGARVSMPGMMDTVLNLGLNDQTVAGLAAQSGNEHFAWDSYRRFVQMYADVVLEVRAEADREFDPFRELIEKAKRRHGAAATIDLPVEALRELVTRFKKIVRERTGRAFPQDPTAQLWGAVGAVFRSWNNARAHAYRDMHGFSHDWGTAVTVMSMVFGNMGVDSGTGVAFTRDPATGERRFYGEFLINAQGEDVVAGTRTPQPIEEMQAAMPDCYRELVRIQKLLEEHYRDMQDLEFTIERGRLFMLQTRTGKRTGFAAVRIATDMVRERRITREEALQRVQPAALDQLLKPIFDPVKLAAARKEGRVLTKALNAGPGAASGRIVFSPEAAVAQAAKGHDVILVRVETSPEDIQGMQASHGFLTQRGGMTSHAALVARQMGKVCISGAHELEISYAKKTLMVGGRKLRSGDWISLNGFTGEVIEGQVPTRDSDVMTSLFGKGRAREKAGATPASIAFQQLMKWSDAVRTLGLRTNADQPDQCQVARAFGAEGIGLCRTEHMFFEGDKIDFFREMILAETPVEREQSLAKLLPLQRKDFEGIFKAMAPYPVTIRTLDPPLHEFLPHGDAQIRVLARKMGVPSERLFAKIEALHESNPMLGHRGCRLGLSHPDITRMQARAIFEAACNVKKRLKKTVHPEIMIPLVGTRRELELQAAEVRAVAEEVFRAKKTKVPYLVGTMIELPRAALTAGEIATEAEFFSFGTNDLTQTTFGMSRDDVGSFVPLYIELGVFERDPFESIDRGGVGRLLDVACREGRAARPGIKLGICGEHGGDPDSIALCQELGLDYVSCSPHRLPVARLAAAQAALAQRSTGQR